MYREIIKVKIVTLYEKLYFFIKNVKSKKKKLALTSFYYVSQEIWLHRQIKILHFLTPTRIQKCLTQLQNILASLTINHLQAESCI